MEIELVKNGKEQSAHLAIWGVPIIQYLARFYATASLSEHNDWKLAGIMPSIHHAGTEQKHGIVQQRTIPLLDRLHPRRNVRELFDEKLIDLQPILRVRMGKQVMDHVVDPQVGEAKGGVIVVQLQCRHSGRISLEPQKQDVAHQSHVLAYVLWDSIGGTLAVRLLHRWSPALQLSSFSSLRDPIFDIADRIQILVQFSPIRLAYMTA